ncbi:MAG: hypothetical protein ACM3NQ_12985 [Bacteroidales bacterium]
MNHPSDDQLVLLFYGEAPADRDAAEHAEHCEECAARLRSLERTLAAVDSHAIPDPGANYGAMVWARIEPRLAAPSRLRWLFAWLAPRRLAFAGAVALLVVAAFVAGRYSSAPTSPALVADKGVAKAPQPAATAAQVRDRVLLVAVGDHLERSKMVLVELMNSPEAASMDISGTQEWARELVPTNRLIRQTANDAGEKGVADVLEDLERVLVEIANSPSRISSAEFEQIRQRVEAQGLVFKIRVLDSQLQQREVPVAPKPDRSRS